MSLELLSSTRYQAIASYDRLVTYNSLFQQFGVKMPLDLILLISKYITFSRAEENQGEIGYAVRRWAEFKASKNERFFSLALDTELFLSAIYGIETTCPKVSLKDLIS